jgi:hypothetical protein
MLIKFQTIIQLAPCLPILMSTRNVDYADIGAASVIDCKTMQELKAG